MTQARRSQAQRRSESRRAIIEAAMSLVAAGEPFESLTIRGLATRSRLAPSGFYRYFADMSALERAIVDDSFSGIEDLVEGLRAPDGAARLPGANLGSLSALIGSHRLPLAFLARQRIAGHRETRHEIRARIRAATRQVAALLSDHSRFERWPDDDVAVFAELMVQVFLHSVDSYLTFADPETGVPDDETCREIDSRAAAQMRLLVAGSRAWRPRASGSGADIHDPE